MMKKFLLTFVSVLLMLTLAFSMTACGDKPGPDNGDGDDGDTTVAELTLTSNLLLDLFQSRQLEAKDKNGVVVAATFTVENSSVVTATADGFLQAISEGNTKVTATYNGNTAECSVTVRDSGARPNLAITTTEKTTVVGQKVSVAPVITYKGAVISAEITVTGGNDAIATYEIKNGEVVFTGVSVGKFKVQIGAIRGGYNLTPIEVTISIINA